VEKEKVKNEGRKMPPKWAWLFIVGCAAIPVVALGGAIPGAIGFGGAAGCYQISINEERATNTKIALCVGITAICWALFIGLMVLAANNAA